MLRRPIVVEKRDSNAKHATQHGFDLSNAIIIATGPSVLIQFQGEN
jgi:hypothetical protein